MKDDQVLKLIQQAAKDKVTRLELSRRKLTNLPAEIGNLTNLTHLYLNANQLTNLPAEIGNLTNLKFLNLSHNCLTGLPSGIGNLINLNHLMIWRNQLASLPVEIGNLINLNQLVLNENKLTNLPVEIGNLINLNKLVLDGNQLTDLPLEIGKLTSLILLSLEVNPLPSLPPEIRLANAPKIVNFYRQQLEQDTAQLYEAKLLILGEGGAGKTTLAKKIQDSSYQLQPDEVSTEGIDVISWHFNLDNGKEFRVNIWDFGGQEIYHATHQFFLTKRSLYALVADTRKEDTDFYYWLNVVKLLSEGSPLLIIKNEK